MRYCVSVFVVDVSGKIAEPRCPQGDDIRGHKNIVFPGNPEPWFQSRQFLIAHLCDGRQWKNDAARQAV